MTGSRLGRTPGAPSAMSNRISSWGRRCTSSAPRSTSSSKEADMTRRLLFQLLAAVAAAAALGAGAEDVVAVVSAKSTVLSLNSAQVADIFLGKTSRFPDGSAAVPIDQVEDS